MSVKRQPNSATVETSYSNPSLSGVMTVLSDFFPEVFPGSLLQ